MSIPAYQSIIQEANTLKVSLDTYADRFANRNTSVAETNSGAE